MINNISNFEYLVGDKNINTKPDRPYNKTVCKFIGDLSNELNHATKTKEYPDIKAFAFWCRKNNIYNK